jgi:flagellar protein FlaG
MKVQSPTSPSTDYGSGTNPLTGSGRSSSVSVPGSEPGKPVSSQAVQPKQLSETELRQALSLLQQKAQTAAPNLQFSIDRDASRVVIKVTDSSTQEVIRQFPPEEILHLDKELTRLQGLLLNRQA